MINLTGMVKLIIFDWDDVFTKGSTEGYFACYHGGMEEVNILLEPEEEKRRIKSKWGKTIPEEFEELLKEHPELVNKAVKKFNQLMLGETFVNQLSIVDGSQELISHLAEKYKLAIASGVNPKVLKEKIFPKFSIPDKFSAIITVYDLEDPSQAKPNPYMPNEIMKRLGITPSEAILVGDAKNDVLMAKNAGIEPVVVLTGHLNREQAEELNVKYIIENVTKLEEVLPLIT